MRAKAIVLLWLAIVLAPALAWGQADDAKVIAFTAEEQAVIDRNPVLGEAVDADPRLVRETLKAMAVARSARAIRQPEPTAPAGAEPSRNPDFERFERAAPEAALELLRRLQEAARKTSR